MKEHHAKHGVLFLIGGYDKIMLMLDIIHQKILSNPYVSMRDDIYGYSFFGDQILIILLSENEALKWMIETEGRSGTLFSFDLLKKEEFQINHIYVKTKDTWYLLRFSDFHLIANKMEMVIYAMKPVYMASAGLLKYHITYEEKHDGINFVFLSVDHDQSNTI